jgi:hypothetical protein
MHAIKGTWQNGQVVLDENVAWPEGSRVLVEPTPLNDELGIREEDWPTTPEATAEWLQWFDSIEPVVLTAEEELEWVAARKAGREYTSANQQKRIEDLSK